MMDCQHRGSGPVECHMIALLSDALLEPTVGF
jgi:hypothetical protein